MKKRLVPLVCGLLAGAALASTAPMPPTPPTPALPPMPALPPAAHLLAQAGLEGPVFFNDGAFHFHGGDGAAERVVKGAPYCAEAEQETVQWLPDGQGGAPNRITRKTSTQLCRDGEGRTRQQVNRGGRTYIYLRDPVAKESWVLDPERKTARPMGGSRNIQVETLVGAEQGERVREMARSIAQRARVAASEAAGSPEPVVIEQTIKNGPGEVRREVQVIRMGREGAPAVDLPPPPPAVQWRAQVLAPRGQATVQPLPARDIEGLRAHGERSSWVIEAGKVGNEKPIQVVREVWTSPDLMLTVQTRDFDPRSGEVNYRLKNLKRGEPDAALMRVPGDYTRPTPKVPTGRAAPAAG